MTQDDCLRFKENFEIQNKIHSKPLQQRQHHALSPPKHNTFWLLCFFVGKIRSQKKKRKNNSLRIFSPFHLQKILKVSTPKPLGPWHKCSDKSAHTDAIRNSGGGINTPSISASAASGRPATWSKIYYVLLHGTTHQIDPIYFLVF